jgi:hypothetical protein
MVPKDGNIERQPEINALYRGCYDRKVVTTIAGRPSIGERFENGVKWVQGGLSKLGGAKNVANNRKG